MATRQEYVDAALVYQGVRWQHGGRTRRRIDCVGLVLVPAITVGLADASWDIAYIRQPNEMDFVSHFRAHAHRELPVAQRKVGSVLVFRDTVCPLHCGILFHRGRTEYVLHASARRRKVCIDPFQGEMRRECFSTCFDMEFADP